MIYNLMEIKMTEYLKISDGIKKRNLAKLPDVCATYLPGTKEPIFIIAGEAGFHRADNSLNVERFNAQLGVTTCQIAAMHIGSAHGWDKPGADPDNHKIWE
jgi:hypothetical protein